MWNPSHYRSWGPWRKKVYLLSRHMVARMYFLWIVHRWLSFHKPFRGINEIKHSWLQVQASSSVYARRNFRYCLWVFEKKPGWKNHNWANSWFWIFKRFQKTEYSVDSVVRKVHSSQCLRWGVKVSYQTSFNLSML